MKAVFPKGEMNTTGLQVSWVVHGHFLNFNTYI